MTTKRTQASRYASIPTNVQETQTLPVQTQPPTQLMSHELHQFTQLIDHDSVEHAHGDTLLNYSPLEGHGNTLVLHDDAPPVRSNGGSSPNAVSAPPLPVEDGLHIGVTAEGHGAIDAPSKEYVVQTILDSDATTEEGDADGIGYLDADADSRVTPFINTVDIGARFVEGGARTTGNLAVANAGNGAPEKLASQRTQEAADGTAMETSQSRPISIASISTEPLAASHSAKFDSNATVEFSPVVFNGKLLEAPDAEPCAAEALLANKAAGSDSMPKVSYATVPVPVPFPYISTSAHVSPVGASLQQALEQETSHHVDLDATVELVASAIESVGTVPGMPVSDIVSTPLTLGLKKIDQEGVANDASPSADVEEPSTKRARELAVDNTETSLTALTSIKVGGGGDAVSETPEVECDNALGKPINVNHTPTGEQLSSLPSGSCVAPTNLRYAESQEPGEETQVNAFKMVDKLVWLDATCMPDDFEAWPAPHDGSIKDHAGAKGRQSLAQAAQMKTVRDKLDVFDWEGSQADKAETPPDVKKVPAMVRSRKRPSEAYKPMTARKKKATSDHQKMKSPSPSCIKNKSDDFASAGREKDTLDVVKRQVKRSRSRQEVTPPTLSTRPLRIRTKSDSRPSVKERKSSSLKSGLRKQVGQEEQTDEVGKEFEAGEQKGSDNTKAKVQQAAPGMEGEPRKRAGRKKSVDESGKELKREILEGSDSKEKKFLQADDLSLKGKRDLSRTSKVGPEIYGNLGRADRTGQDDAVADIWIEAFASNKSKTKGSDVELIKFRKQSIEQDSKKCRTVEPSKISRDEEHEERRNMFEKEETPPKEKRVEMDMNIRQDSKRPKNVDTSKISPHKVRRVSSRLSQAQNQGLDKKETSVVEEQSISKSKKPRHADSQVKARRASTRDHEGKHRDVSKREDTVMNEEKAEGGHKTRQDQKQLKTADAMMLPPVISKGVSMHGHEVEHLNRVENIASNGMLERGPRTRSKAQDVKNLATGKREGNRAENAISESRTTQLTDDTDGRTLSRGAILDDLEMVKLSAKTRNLKRKESTLSRQPSTVELKQDVQEIETVPCLAAPPLSNVTEGVPAGGPILRKKRRRDDEALAPESRRNSVSQSKEENTDTKMEELEKGAASKSTVLRRTRGNMCDIAVDMEKDGAQSHGESASDKQTTQIAKKVLRKPVFKLDTKIFKSMPSPNKKTSAHEVKEKPLISSGGGRRRKREPGCICVLFSHSLTEDTIKHQKKILAKLGGQLAMSALDCSHFVSNGFVRTQNMLMSMAAGKIVATPMWLENCGQAHYFVDAKKYILQDKKKERELGFSMAQSLASAEHKPLLKGFRVLVSPNTVPEPTVLQAIVESAGGQIMDIKSLPSLLDANAILVANERDSDFCLQFLDKGLKVYSEELVLHGIVTQTLDFSRYRLFEDFKQQKGLRSAG